MSGVSSIFARGLLLSLLAACASSTAEEEAEPGKVVATVRIPDAPRSISSAAVLDEVDVGNTAAAAPPCTDIPDTWAPESGPVPDPWEPTRHTTTDGKKD